TPLANHADSKDLFDFVACSGARIVNADTQEQPKSYFGVTTPIPLQLDQLGDDVDLVTLTFGGNDIGFGPIVLHCVTKLECYEDPFITLREGTSTADDVTLEDWADIRLALVQNELTGLYRAVQNRVREDTTIIAATYPRLVADEVTSRFGLCTEAAVL